MPQRFESKRDYVAKLAELLLVQAECERANIEMVSAKNVRFMFNERLEIYSKLTLKIPKALQSHIRPNVIMSVAIRESETGKDYLGTGVVKTIKMQRKNPYLTVQF